MKGVTDAAYPLLLLRTISIHTPVKGVTDLRVMLHFLVNYFNPHTREGCDGFSVRKFPSLDYFNPHTREGCDSFHSIDGLKPIYFNPHTREGCDDVSIDVYVCASTFQSTHP